MAIDLKYGHVTTEFGSIGEDEPVVVFRARDFVLPDLLDNYGSMCRSAGSPIEHLELISAARMAVIDWQRENGRQVPRSAGFTAARRFTKEPKQ